MRTLTGNNPRREQRLQQLMLDRLQVIYQAMIAREIARAMRESAQAVSDGLPPDIHLNDHKKRLTAIIGALWTRAGREMSGHIAGSEKSIKKMEFKDFTIPPTEVSDNMMARWIATIGVEKVKEIGETTLSNIRAAIEQGIADGLTEKEIARKINAFAPQISVTRAQTIARTETHSAANMAAFETAKAVGVDMMREWVSAENERTRQSHRDADGQRVKMDQPFVIGGHKIMFPGDYSAGVPHETINCRCVVAYVVGD